MGTEQSGEGISHPRGGGEVVEELLEQLSLELHKLQLVNLARQVPVPVWE